MIFYRVMDDLLTDSLYEELNDECGWQEVEAEGEGDGEGEGGNHTESYGAQNKPIDTGYELSISEDIASKLYGMAGTDFQSSISNSEATVMPCPHNLSLLEEQLISRARIDERLLYIAPD